MQSRWITSGKVKLTGFKCRKLRKEASVYIRTGLKRNPLTWINTCRSMLISSRPVVEFELRMDTMLLLPCRSRSLCPHHRHAPHRKRHTKGTETRRRILVNAIAKINRSKLVRGEAVVSALIVWRVVW
jgi:hypothetical protein